MDLTYGIAGVLVGGILNGSFVAPMKKMPGWKWENSWLVYSIAAAHGAGDRRTSFLER